MIESRKYRLQQPSLISATADFMQTYEDEGYEINRIEEIMIKSLWDDDKEVRMSNLLKRKIQSPLGIEDYRYYYIYFIKEWFKYWASEKLANRPSKLRTMGTSVPTDLVAVILNDRKRHGVGCFVISTVDKFYYMTIDQLHSYLKRSGIWNNEKTGREMLGIEKGVMLENDPYL